MTKTKDKEKIEVVRVNSIDEKTDEVFLYREDPYVNEVRRVPSGTFKLGAVTEAAIEKKEEG